jgi:hypothetical protein
MRFHALRNRAKIFFDRAHKSPTRYSGRVAELQANVKLSKLKRESPSFLRFLRDLTGENALNMSNGIRPALWQVVLARLTLQTRK